MKETGLKHVVTSRDNTHLKVVEVIVQQYCGIGDAFLGPDKYKWHHSLRERVGKFSELMSDGLTNDASYQQ